MKLDNLERSLKSRYCGVPPYEIPDDVKFPCARVFSQSFFKCFCKATCATKKRLDMSKNTVYQKIKRPLKDFDLPALLVFLKKHQDVVYINLANNNITSTGFINLLQHARLYKNIEELDVRNNDITEIGIKCMLDLADELEIQRLCLKANKFGDKGAKKVALFLLKNVYMLHLNVSEVDLTASSLIYFIMVLSSEQLISNTTLKSLDISRPNPGCMYYFDSVHFANVIGLMLKYNTTLTALHLQKYNFSCHDIENMMSNAKYNITLRLLDLGCNNIGDHGVAQLANWISQRPALKILILCRNIITDHGARSLSFAFPSSKLLLLDISFNKITDDGMVSVLNALKKTPFLRELYIFGNCIGHPAAKIVKRMLVSEVLHQDNIDVRPYRVDHRWYFARYQAGICKKEYYDIPYSLTFKPPEIRPKTKFLPQKYYNYIHTKESKVQIQYSTLKFTLGKDCKCCYCMKCDDHQHDEECRNAKHLDTCTCCRCRGDESSDWSVDQSIIDRFVPAHDPTQNITHILEHLSSKTQKRVLKWINIDDNNLDDNVKAVLGHESEESSSSESIKCTCSWIQLTGPTLKKCLETDSSKDLIVIPKSCPVTNAKQISREKTMKAEKEICPLRYCSKDCDKVNILWNE